MKKITSKFLSIILVMTLLLNMFSPFTVFALELIEQEEQIQKEQTSEIYEEEVPLPEEKEISEEKNTSEEVQNKEEVSEDKTGNDKEIATIDNTTTTTITTKANEETTSSIPMTDIAEKGNIEVETHLVLPIVNCEKNNLTFTIYDSAHQSASINLNKVNEPQDGYYEDTIKLGDQKIRFVATERDKDGHLLSGVDKNENVVYISVNLYSLNKGNYTIELKGKHFITYQVPVTLDKFSKRVKFTDEKGMFEIGDINGDGKVTELDSNLMLDALDSNSTKYDLNLDGVVDIADLNYISAIIYGQEKSASIEDTNAIIESKNISFEVNEKILSEESADLSSIFTDEGIVKLQQVDNNPIELGIDLSGQEKSESVPMREVRITVGENAPQGMLLRIETESGEIIEKNAFATTANNIHYFTEEVSEGTLKIDLGKQVAVKKVTIVVTETSTNKLADIAKVEFLNNVKVETSMPENFYTPTITNIDTSVSEQLTVNFSSVPNVTGYEIEIVGPKINTIFQTTFTTFTIEDLKNYATYNIRVQSVNQEWRSGWSDISKASPQSTRKPPAVDMVTATPTYSGIDFGWKDMDDTLSYNIYYRKVGSEEYTKISEITGTKYSLKGLEAAVEYEAYLTGNNPLGEGSASQTVKAKTLKADAAIVPQYKLINTKVANAEKNNHIKDVIYADGTMTDNNKFAIVDDKFATYWEKTSWHAGTYYSENSRVPIVVLDKAYKMDEFILTVPDSYQYTLKTTPANDGDIMFRYWQDETETFDNSTRTSIKATLKALKDENGRIYYLMKLDEPVTANAVQFGVTVANNGSSAQISEVKLYEYDSLVDDVAKLFVDDLRVELAKGVTQKDIDALRERANIKDNDEYSPYRDSVLADLDYAEKILKDEKLNDVIVLNPNISNSYNSHLKFAMTINDYQPLGIVARPGDTLNVYVGSTGKINVQLVYTQYHAEANAWSKTYNLQKGQNIITIDAIGSAESERGGSVYVRYTSAPDTKNPIKVRVSGGTKIPMLDVSTITDATEKEKAIKTYISDLQKYNASLENIYAQEEKTFDNRNSVLASTEIVTEHGLFSVSSLAVENALNSVSDKVSRLAESTYAFDEMMEMFYRQKGLKRNAEDKKDEMPKARINIRYMRMFDGAFMYAGGYHVGIEYGSIAGLVQASRNTDAATGYFGWGISHEVGHQINQSDTVFAEVTNNIYALLAQTSNDSDKSRLEISNIYEKIYSKVTSHTLGRAQNVFVQLGMYWQLHLAYDDNKTFEDTNSVYSKINHYSRTYNNTKKYTRDELTILYACMATGKDLTDFFATWGLTASDTLKEELATLDLEKETKAIYYLNDAARRYRLSGQKGISATTKLDADISESNSQDKRVTLNFNVNAEEDKILGYEILRNNTSIGFVTGDTHTFTDVIGAENNRAYTYQIVAYDYLLNKTNTITLDEIKISHDGSIVKDNFTIESNFKEKGEIVDNEDETLDHAKLHVNNLIDGNAKTGFNGTERIRTLSQTNDRPSLSNDNNNAYVIINLNAKMAVSGIKYRALVENATLNSNTIKKYKISVSSNGTDWTIARTGTFNLTVDKPEETIYFMGQDKDSESQLWTYNDISYIKIESDGNRNGLSGAEIDIIAPPGDNIDLEMKDETTPVIGILENDYCYLTEGCPNEVDENGDPVGIIKKDSVIIQGSYRGSPSFNNILIGDANDDTKVYSGYQLIFAEINSDMTVYEVAKGTWLFVMTKEQYEAMLNSSSAIRAYLYRVNDAVSLDGQRLTSTSKAVSNLKAYNELEKIQLTSTTKND